jgi:hypothetical protein
MANCGWKRSGWQCGCKEFADCSDLHEVPISGNRQYPISENLISIDNLKKPCIIQAKKERKKMRNLIVLNNKAELVELLNNNDLNTFVDNVAFALDLLDMVRANDNVVEINEDLGFVDDGGWIQIDDMGYVVEEFAVP